MPVFALYNFDDASTVIDDAAENGQQNGIYSHSPDVSGGQLHLNGVDQMAKIYAAPEFQLDRGTLEISFTPTATAMTGNQTVLSRDSVGEHAGSFRIEVTPEGAVVITHELDGSAVVTTTDAGFYTAGDTINLNYSWDLGGAGGAVEISNVSTGGSFTAEVPDSVTMDMGDLSQPWYVGAGQSHSDPWMLNNLDSHFQGSVDMISISDSVDNLQPEDQDPVANPDLATTDEDTPVVIDVLANDTDPQGQTLTVTGGTAEHGTVTLNDDGTITYTPDADWNGTDEITYSVVDPDGNTASSTVTVTVNPVNDAPVANDDTATTQMDVPVVIAPLANDTDVDGDTLVIQGTPSSANGSVVVNDDGTLTFTPDAGFTGDAVIDYEISDGNGGTDTAQIVVTVTPPGTGPQPDGIVTGTDGDDLIVPGYVDHNGDAVDGNDAIIPGDGPNDDRIYAGAGNDTIRAGEGDDTVYGGTGDDQIYGGVGDDLLYGGAGNDSIYGGYGSDTVYGGGGNDLIDTSVDNDPNALPDIDYPGYYGADTDPNNDRDLVYGGAGNDTIRTGDDADTIFGGRGDDHIDGGIDADYIHGGAGNDTLIGGEGADTIIGGRGDDLIFGGLDDRFGDILDIPDDRDLRPENNTDLLFGGAGNDTIYGRDDDDTLYGGGGNDLLFGGIDDDLLYGGFGNDTLNGDQGNDTLYGGDGQDVLYGGAGDDELHGRYGGDTLYAGEGDDIAYGNRGDDLIYGGAGNDTLYGGANQDTLYGGDGDDVIYGGGGSDTLYGDAGNDTMYGDAGDDVLYGGDGDDVIFGGRGADTIYGGAGHDTLFGDAGDDVIYGGYGQNVIFGGKGADTIYVESGGDTIFGGADRDVIVITNQDAGIGTWVDGNEEGDDYDTLDLSNAGPLRIEYDPTNPENGRVHFLDRDGNEVGFLDFRNIENVIPCFTPGTLIATPKGEVPVESLQPGDRVITRDNGIQEIRWIGEKALTGQELRMNSHLQPVLVKAHSLGNGLPERDMLVSPNHRLLVANDRTQLHFDEHEVLVAAKHMVGAKGISAIESIGVTYVHFMCDRHEVVLSNGAWTETFQPGDYTMKGMGNAQRNEIFELFPELKTPEGLGNFQAARRTLKRHEALILTR